MKQNLFNSLNAGFNITQTQGQMDDFLTALDKNGLKLVSKCDCEPFQSCEKCSNKTEWKDPLIFLPDDSKYWILNTKTNFIKKGSRYINKTNEEFECEDGEIIYFDSSMFAEIKPPKVLK